MSVLGEKKEMNEERTWRLGGNSQGENIANQLENEADRYAVIT